MRWKCTCSYDGTGFNGWQSQPCKNTIQDNIETRLASIFGKEIRIHGSGRTDAGVHADEQVFHFDAEWGHGSDTLRKAINCGIPKEIRIFSVEEVDKMFHARFSAKGKQYKYYILEGDATPFNYKYVWSIGRRRLNLDAMSQAANDLIGEHDFKNFAAKRDCNDHETTVKEIRSATFSKNDNMIVFTISGSGFLYKMVRIIIGCLVQVGQSNRPIGFLSDGLSPICECADEFRKECAPACGLFLDKVFY